MDDYNITLAEQASATDSISKYLTFWSNGNLYAVSTFEVLQIIEKRHVTPIPESPSYIKGILNIREHNIPIIDLGTRLDKTKLLEDKNSRIVLLSTAAGDLGLIVEQIDKIIDLPQKNISSVPQIVDSRNTHLLTGIAIHDNKLIPILNIPALLSDTALEKINADSEKNTATEKLSGNPPKLS